MITYPRFEFWSDYSAVQVGQQMEKCVKEKNVCFHWLVKKGIGWNAAAEWLPFWLRILEEPDSNLDTETGNPERFFVVFLNSFK
jgi:hypothetical protein